MPGKSLQTPSDVSVPLWAKATVILCVVLTGAGAVIAFVNPGMLVQSHAEITSAVRTYAGYLTSRNAVLAIMLLMLLIMKAYRALGNLLAIVGLIQVLDSVIDCIEERWTIAPGVLVLGIIFLVGASRLCGPLWRRDAWI
jgi:ABC-type polysaccharide/polyol phosphate export permease